MDTVALDKNLPIGIFDSGIGGLTVAKTLVELLPHESFIYFGDTANLPYGDKKASDIQAYAKKIVDFFLEKKVKMVVIACNTASAAAFEVLRDHIGERALLVDVVNPVAGFLCKNYCGKRVGLIGTKFTVESGIYGKKLSQLGGGIKLFSLATPALASMIERYGLYHEELGVALYDRYLSNQILQDIEALVLGCTHYPIIKNEISNFYKGKIDVIDISEIVANEVNLLLAKKDLLAESSKRCSFYVSSYTDSFVNNAKRFFGDIEVNLVNGDE